MNFGQFNDLIPMWRKETNFDVQLCTFVFF